MFSAMNPNLTPISRDHHKKIFKIIQALLVYEQSNVFRKPIPHKSLGWEDYKDIVKKPIDLNYVRRQNSEGKYKFVEEVLDEIELIWDNVFNYGKREHQSYPMALKMVKHFDELIKDYLPEYYDKINRVAYFKQYEPVKTEKKTSNISNDKNSKKAEKMDIENMKDQVIVQKNPRGTTSTRRRDNANMNIKQQNEEQSIPISSVNLVHMIEEAKKKVGSKEKIVESKRPSYKANEMIQVEQKQPNVEDHKKIQTIESAKVPKVNQTIENQKPKAIQPVAIETITAQQQQLSDQPPISHQQQSISILAVQSIDIQDSQQNHFQPIIVKLNKTPSNEEVIEVTQMMRLLFELQEMETISKVVKILTKYEKENMVIDGEDVNFRMNQIHISTYSRIRKELQDKIKQLQHSQKFKELNRLKEKLNINLLSRATDKINQKSEGSKIVEEN